MQICSLAVVLRKKCCQSDRNCFIRLVELGLNSGCHLGLYRHVLE